MPTERDTRASRSFGVEPLPDQDNAYALDIFQVDGATTSSKVHGGDHWRPTGDVENMFEGALVGNGRFIRFDLRAKHSADLDVFGVAVVVTLD